MVVHSMHEGGRKISRDKKLVFWQNIKAMI